MGKTALIVAKDEIYSPVLSPENIVNINGEYQVWYYDEADVPPLSVSRYSYAAIPKCLGLLSRQALEESGIIKLQQQPTLSLSGQGVFVAIIDTGIQLEDLAFRGTDGKSRVFSVWDQTREGTSPEGFFYGEEYNRDEIDKLLLEGTKEQLPARDEIGHGTFMASVACGSPDEVGDFIGVASEAELIVVKLREAPAALKNYYYIPEEAVCYSEADIMTAIAYVEEKARVNNRPLVLMLGLGCNNGGHNGALPINRVLDDIASQRHRAVVVAAGNQANERVHFSGRTNSLIEAVEVEINVTSKIEGLYGELWGLAPERFAVSVISPSGERYPKAVPVAGEDREYYFPFEDARVSIEYRDIGRNRRDQLILMRFSNISEGVWRLNVLSQNIMDGKFDIWLPMRQLQQGENYFLKSDPDITLTMPSDTKAGMSVGGYRVEDGAVLVESGRGFCPDMTIKPDFVSPAAGIMGKGLRGQYVSDGGTSAAAAITGGASALLLEWAVVRGNAVGINSVDIKNLIIRGCNRRDNVEYPNPLQGYGIMNIYSSFRLI